jgi:lipopolysaccharide exporter
VANPVYRTDSITSRTAIGAAWMVAWRMVTRGLGLLSTLILAHLLAPADFGLVAVAISFATGIDSLSELGLQAALVRRTENDASMYDTAFTMQAVRGLLTGIIVATGAWAAGAWFGDSRLMPLLLILAGTAAISGFDNIAVVQFQRDMRFDMEFRMLFVPRVLQFLAATAAAIILRTYWALIIGVVVARISRTFMTYWVQPYRPRLDLSRWRDLVGFSFWSWASSMASIVWERCDAFVLGPALGMEQLGVFLLSMEIGLLPTTELVSPATRPLYAGVASARNRGTDPIALGLHSISTLTMIVLPIGLGISATSGYLMTGLLGPTWAVGRQVISILALLCMVSPITFVSTTILNATGYVRQNFFAVAGSAALRVAAVYSVAGYQRLDWAALAIFCVHSGEAMLFLRQLASRGRLVWRNALPGIARTAVAAAIMAAFLWFTGLGWQNVTTSPLEALLIGGTIGLGCIIGCSALQMALWFGAGRPRGPEDTVIALAIAAATRVRRQTRFA